MMRKIIFIRRTMSVSELIRRKVLLILFLFILSQKFFQTNAYALPPTPGCQAAGGTGCFFNCLATDTNLGQLDCPASMKCCKPTAAATTTLAAVNFQKFQEKIFGTPAPGGSPNPFADPTNPASLGIIISEFLKYFFPFAGLALFIYLLIGGFTYLTSGGDQKAMEKAQGQITNAVIGFVIIFAAYWMVQIFEFIFGISVFK